MNKNGRNLSLILKNALVFYFVTVVLCGISVCFLNIWAGLFLIFGALIGGAISIMYRRAMMQSSLKYYSSMAEVNDKFDITKGVTMAMVSVGTDGKINWWNDAFQNMFPYIAMHDGITEHMGQITMDLLCRMGKGEECRIEHGEKVYVLTNMPFKAENATDSAFVLTLRDITDLEMHKKDAENSRAVVALAVIDNYDELVNEDGNEMSYQVEKQIDDLIFDWARKIGGGVRRVEKGRYFCIFNAKMLSKIKEGKFDILEKAKELKMGSVVEPTLSIGVGVDGADINETDSFAKAALDMALGRGGDQAVIKDGGNFSYFGGNSRETEKKTKVKARVKALALVRLIEESENVIVMGHSYADADSFGASVALACVAMARGKQAKVLIETYDSTVKHILDSFEKNQTHSNMFVNKMQARELIKSKTLVIVCDTHRRSLVASTEILDEAASVVLIDHHRRSEEFILNTDLLYHEPFASSSCEMVTEMLQYMGRGGINAEIADAMYAGILVDTNNFIYKTGVRTFEAAAYLKRLGADTVNVKKMLRENSESYMEKAKIVADATVYRDTLAISKVYEEAVAQEVIAKAANDILELENVTAAFVIAPNTEGVISISGRSFGDVNIQMIAEKLGGGGHMLAGAAQLSGVSIDEAEEILKKAIDEYEESR